MSRRQSDLLRALTLLAGGDSGLVENAIRRHADVGVMIEDILAVRAGDPPLPETRSRWETDRLLARMKRNALPWWRRIFTPEQP